MFSKLVYAFQLPKNRLYKELHRRKSAGEPVIDLISGNVNEHGIFYPKEAFHEAMMAALQKSLIHRPDPFGPLEAREAISQFYDKAGVKISADSILLTPGTSLSYSYAFSVLADRGDEILAPQPSYPLFDSIAAVCGVTMKPYPLVRKGRWTIDLKALEAQITARTRAIILISPHNPTGAVSSREEVAGLAALARKHDLPVISDEVFSPFIYSDEPLPRAAQTDAPLVLTLNGFSKMFALAGFKLGWIAVSGDPDKVQTALDGLEHISDSFLPVSDISQFAVGTIFRHGDEFLSGYRAEMKRRRDVAIRILQEAGCSFEAPKGGFHVAFQVPGLIDGEEAAVRLLRETGILLHPGHFYDLSDDYGVITFVEEPERLEKDLTAALEYLKRQA